MGKPEHSTMFPEVPAIHRARRPRWLSVLARKALCLARWEVVGQVPVERRFVLVAGAHTSNWDFVVGMLAILALDINLHWIGKNTIFRKPFAGVMRWLGGMPVDRSSPEGFADQVAKRMRDPGQYILALTPEGTRKPVARLKTGFSRIARKTPCPILPLTLDYQRRQLRLHPLREASDDPEADADIIREIFASAVPRHPANF